MFSAGITRVSNIQLTNDIIDLEDHSHALGRELECRHRYEKRLQDLLLKHIGDGARSHVDTGGLLAVDMSSAQLRHHVDRRETRTLRESVRDDIQRSCIRLDTITVDAAELTS